MAISQYYVGYHESSGENVTAFPRLHPKGTSSRFALRAPRPLRGLAMTIRECMPFSRWPVSCAGAAPGGTCPSPTTRGRSPAYSSFFIFQSSVFIIPYFIHPPAGDGKPYDKTSGNSLPFVQISPEPPDLSLTTGAFIDKIISENKGAVCPLQQARQPAKNLFVTHDPNTRDQYRRTTQWIKNASLP